MSDKLTAVVLNAGPLGMRALCGRPLLAHSVSHALESGCVDRVVVCTQNADEAALARELGCVVASTPAETATDAPRLYLSASCPLRAPGDVAAAAGLLRQADAVVSVVRVEDRIWTTRQGGAVGGAQRLDGRDPWFRQTFSLAVGRGREAALSPFAPSAKLRTALHEMDPESGLLVSRPAQLEHAAAALRERQRRRAAELVAGLDLLVLDFDGVLTDNRVLVDETGKEAVLANRSDGLGLGMLRRAGVKVVVLSAEINPVVARRCEKLKIDFVQGIETKIDGLATLFERQGVGPDKAGYMGNDVNDLACMARCAVSFAPSDAHPAALTAATLVTERPGGFGAVREVVDWLLAARAS